MVDYTNEIGALKILWERQLEHFKDVCKKKGEIMKNLKEIENEEILTETCITGLQIAIEELRKLQIFPKENELPSTSEICGIIKDN